MILPWLFCLWSNKRLILLVKVMVCFSFESLDRAFILSEFHIFLGIDLRVLPSFWDCCQCVCVRVCVCVWWTNRRVWKIKEAAVPFILIDAIDSQPPTPQLLPARPKKAWMVSARKAGRRGTTLQTRPHKKEKKRKVFPLSFPLKDFGFATVFCFFDLLYFLCCV